MTTTTLDAAPATSAPASRPAPAAGRRDIILLFAGLMVTMLLASLDQTVLSTALPTIVGELHGVEHMSWVVTAYVLASTVTMPVYGRISDIFGRRPVLLVAIALFMGGSLIGGLAGSMEWLVIGRAVQGLGGGGLMILSQAAIADAVPARERGKYMGIMGAVFAVSSVAGPLLGGWLTEGPGWRWTFWINLPLGALAMIAVAMFLRLPRPERTGERTDYLGMALVAAATSAIVLACTWGGGTYDWTSWQILGLVAGAIVLAAAFVAVEAKADSPVIPMDLFRNRDFVVSTVAALLIGVAMFGALGYMPTYIQMVVGVDATQAGLLMIPMMAGVLVASTASGAVVSKTGRYKAFPIVGTAIMGVGLGLLATLAIDTPTWVLCCYLAVLGVGIGLALQILTLVVQNAFPAAMVGTATGAINYFRQVGATVGSAVVGSVFASRLTDLMSEKLSGLGNAAQVGGDTSSLTPELVASLPAPIHDAILAAYNEALVPVLGWMVPLAVVSVIVLFFLRETPLATGRQDAAIESIEEAAAATAGLPAHETAEFAFEGRGLWGTVTDPRGHALAGANLTLADQGGREVGRTRTDAAGRYTLPLAEADGSHLLIAAAAGWSPAARLVQVGAQALRCDVALAGGARLTGGVVRDDGTRAAGAVLTLTDAGGDVVDTARVGGEGTYTLDGLRPGSYVLTARIGECAPHSQAVAVAENGTGTWSWICDVTLPAGARLGGDVRTPDGSPAVGASVEVADASGRIVATTTTDANGAWGVDDLDVARYTVTAGYAPVRVETLAGRPEATRLVLGDADLPALAEAAPAR